MALVGLFHGLLAGNVAGTGGSEAHIGTVFFSFNWGTICFVISVLLGLSFLFRKVLKKSWMRIQRILTVCLLILVVVHIADVGIRLPSYVLDKENDSADEGAQVEDDINASLVFSGAQLKDGVYEGSAEGYKDTIKVSVTVEGGAVTDIEILEENDTPEFFERARGIIDDILSAQSLNVDAVSGATYSSVGILNAVNSALESAVIDGELEHNDIELPSNAQHEHGRQCNDYYSDMSWNRISRFGSHIKKRER